MHAGMVDMPEDMSMELNMLKPWSYMLSEAV